MAKVRVSFEVDYDWLSEDHIRELIDGQGRIGIDYAMLDEDPEDDSFYLFKVEAIDGKPYVG